MPSSTIALFGENFHPENEHFPSNKKDLTHLACQTTRSVNIEDIETARLLMTERMEPELVRKEIPGEEERLTDRYTGIKGDTKCR